MAIKYKEIASILRKQILSDGLPVSYKLPTEQELCSIYSVSRQTIRQALSVLISEGLIYGRQGSGIYTIPLSKDTNGNVVFLLSEENEYIYPAFLSTMKKLLKNQNITPDIAITRHNYNTERQLLFSLLKKPPIVLVVEGVQDAFDNPNLDLYEQLMAQNVSLVFIHSGYTSLPSAYHITADDFEGGYLLGEHFIASGLYEISFILPDYAANAKTRYLGLLAAFKDHALPMPDKNIFWYSYYDVLQLRNRQDTHFLHRFIHSGQKGNAVFCYNDEIAYHLMKELNYAHISVPDMLAVASFDNSYLSRLSTPPLTTLSLDEQALEKEIAALIGFILKKQSGSKYIYHLQSTEFSVKKTLPWKLISRGSVPTF